jgi:hypothetical protein
LQYNDIMTKSKKKTDSEIMSDKSPLKIAKNQPILALKPTQFAIGVAEVEFKAHELKNLNKRKLKKEIGSRPIQVVVAPWGDLYVVDHHHWLFACWHIKINRLPIEIVKDYSHRKMTYSAFWRQMSKRNFAYLYDQFGEGPRNPLYLPLDVRGLADDPYRSLAWIVRKEGAFNNCDESFAEFQWADFFRKEKLLESHGRQGLHRAVKKAFKLARSSRARNLPGFIKIKQKKKKLKIPVKSKFIHKPKTTGPLASLPDVEVRT